MIKVVAKKVWRRSNRAQAIVELAVFGAIFIFVVGTIIQQGFSAASAQQYKLQSLRHALLLSYNDGMAVTSKRGGASFMIVEDRLSPGLLKYGPQDRLPIISYGSGSMSRNLYMPVDWSDIVAAPAKNSISVTDLKVNGQAFELRGGVAYYLRLSRNNVTGVVTALASLHAFPEIDPCSALDSFGVAGRSLGAENIVRLQREWPNAYSVSAKGNDNFVPAGADWQFDYNRNGIFTDDLWNLPTLRPTRNTQALWQWVRKSIPEVAALINIDDGDYPSYDVTGDKSEDMIYDHGPVFGDYICAASSYTVYDLAILDSATGEMSAEDVYEYEDPHERQGLKMDSWIHSEVQGNELEFRHGGAYVATATDLSMSHVTKDQFDVISRIFQLNRKMLFPEMLSSWNPAIEVQCGNPLVLAPVGIIGGTGCCMTAANAYRTCFDMGSRTLYIRSRIRDVRGRMWINKVVP